jgi:hypothetical protein
MSFERATGPNHLCAMTPCRKRGVVPLERIQFRA